jgi:hypothetical protein
MDLLPIPNWFTLAPPKIAQGKRNMQFPAPDELGEVSEWLKEHAWKVCVR